MNQDQFRTVLQCSDCLNDLKQAFLYDHPKREDVFSDADAHYDLLVDYAISVLMESGHEETIYDGFFEGSDPYMTIKGVNGCYVAFNNDSCECFSTLAEAKSYTDDGWGRLQAS
jgi:dienelactone hydrolase